MAHPIDINLRDISKLDEGDVKPKESRSFIDCTIDKVAGKSTKDLILGTLTGWIAGVALVRIGKVAAFGLGARSSQSVTNQPATPEQSERPLPDPIVRPKSLESYKPAEESNLFLEKPAFLPPKHMPHSPKISPSSIPNPNPSIMSTKQESGYPNYGGYLYSIPGYSAFQPISYPGVMQPSQAPIQPNDTPNSEFIFPSTPKETIEDKSTETKPDNPTPKADIAKPQTDFEEQFTPEIVPAVSMPEVNKSQVESKMSITSLTQGSGATVTIPSQVPNKDGNKKKMPERFSLKTSIPISKIDMKCVSNPPESIFQSSVNKKAPATFNPAFQSQKTENGARVEIQSNIVIKTAEKEPEIKDTKVTVPTTNINTLINAAEAINKNDSQFRKPEPKQEVINEIKDPPPNFSPPAPTNARPMFNQNTESNKATFPPKPPDGPFNEQKNQIVFIQNKNPSNPKMLLTIQQQNPQVLLQRTNFDSKNLQAPSRLSSQSKKSKDDPENGASSKVVALKRLHQENCDENDFENLITENQIYGNKIVVKEKSQGTQQEQDLKNKNKTNDKTTQAETKNVVLQPNFLYLSNVQFPANLMMIKNNTKITQTTESNKTNKLSPNENKTTNEVSTMTNSDVKTSTKTQNVTVNKDIHVLKSSNNLLPNKNSKTDIVFQTPHQKVIMNSKIVYKVPMIVDTDSKPFINRDYPKFLTQNKKDYTKNFDQQKSNDKLFIACPYQMDSKLQPKIVITNIRHKITKIDEVSCIDIYEKRKRMRRLKHLCHRDTKESSKGDTKKAPDKADSSKNIITPDKMKAEIYKEFANSRLTIDEGISESDSDYGEENLDEYNTIIKDFTASDEDVKEKADFLANFRLATRDAYKEKELDRQERTLRRDSVASAYIAAGRLDRLANEECTAEMKPVTAILIPKIENPEMTEKENVITSQKKQIFLSQLRLTQVNAQFKEGYERSWQEILKERKRRNGITEPNKTQKQPKLETENIDLDPNGQLLILTEIKKCVTDNNNLIKKRLDSSDESSNDGDSIRILAEKNFSELNRLSKMADRSVKLMTGQDTRKRDLTPGFDSENIKKLSIKVEQPFHNYPQINIPNISKIISLKSMQETMTSPLTSQGASTQPTSMDEPQNSAAGVTDLVRTATDIEQTSNVEKTKDFGCQVEETFAWPGWEAVMKSYREHESARKKEITDLHRRNTSLRVDGAHITRSTAHHSERARALLAERQHLATEENAARLSLQRICSAIDVIRSYI